MTSQSLEYQSASVTGASSVQLVCMLYDTVARDLNRAIAAVEARDVETRTSEVKHALLVLQQLEAFLDMENGGEAAINLSRFYALIRAGIVRAQAKMDPAIFREQIALLMDVRSAWEQAGGKSEQKSGPVNPGPQEPARPAGSHSLSCSV